MKVISSILCLLTGASVYLLWRTPRLLATCLLTHMGLQQPLLQARHWASSVTLPPFVLYCLPGALWSAAYILLVSHTCAATCTRAHRLGVAAVIPVLGAGSEALQALHLLPGTADVLDAAAYALPYFVYLLISII